MSYKRNLLIFISVIIAAFIFWYSFSLQKVFYEIVEFLNIYIKEHESTGILAFMGLGVLSAMLSPFSSAPLIPAAILIWGKFLTFILLSISWMLGASITYYVGYSIGYLTLKQVIPFEKIEYYRQRIPRRAEFWLVLMFRLSMPAEVPGYTLGIIRYDFWKYLFATTLSEVSFAAVTIYASQAFIEKDPVIFIGLIGFTIITMSSMFYLFHKYLRVPQK